MKQRYIYIAAALLTLGVTGVRSAFAGQLTTDNCQQTLHSEANNCQPSTHNSQLTTHNPDTTSILSTLNSETLQASKEARPLTLRECLEKGLNKNYSLRIIRNEEQMAANNATMENAGLLP